MRISSTGARGAALACFAVVVAIGQGCGSSSSDTPRPLDLDAGPVEPNLPDGSTDSDGGTTPLSDSGKPIPPPPTEATRLHDFRDTAAIRPYALTALGQDLVISGADNFQDVAGNRNAMVMRADLVGDVKWAKRFSGAFNDQFLAQVVVGTTLHAFGITRTVFTGATPNVDVLWAQLDVATGAVVGSRHLGTVTNEDLLDVAPVTGGVVIVGTTTNGADAYVARLDTKTSAVTWARRWSTPGIDVFHAVRAVPDGILAFGHSSLVAGGKLDPVVAKFDNLGNHLWSRAISGGAEDENIFSVRVVSDGFVVVGDTKPAAGTPKAGLALKLSLDGATVMWAKSYAAATATTWRGSALLGSDPVYELPETVVVNGSSGSAASVARIATETGLVVTAALDLAEADGGAMTSDGEVVWQRPDRGLGFLLYATAMGSSVSSLGMALPNRLLGFAAPCASASKPVHTVSDVALSTAPLTPTVAALALGVANNGVGLPVSDLPLVKTTTCN